MTTTVLLVAVGLLLGVVLGACYFGGLLWTTRRLSRSDRHAALLAVSLVVRLAVVGVGFVLLAMASPVLLVAAAVGLVGSRVVLTRERVLDRWFADTTGLTGGSGDG